MSRTILYDPKVTMETIAAMEQIYTKWQLFVPQEPQSQLSKGKMKDSLDKLMEHYTQLQDTTAVFLNNTTNALQRTDQTLTQTDQKMGEYIQKNIGE